MKMELKSAQDQATDIFLMIDDITKLATEAPLERLSLEEELLIRIIKHQNTQRAVKVILIQRVSTIQHEQMKILGGM